MDVDELRHGRVQQLPVLPQGTEAEEFGRIFDAHLDEAAAERVGAAVDGGVVVVEDDAERGAGGRADLALEGGQQRQQHVHPELGLLPAQRWTESGVKRRISYNMP